MEQEVTGSPTHSWHATAAIFHKKREQPYHTACLACFPENGSIYQDVLMEMTGQKTVPNVFVNKTNLGGSDKTMQVITPYKYEH